MGRSFPAVWGTVRNWYGSGALNWYGSRRDLWYRSRSWRTQPISKRQTLESSFNGDYISLLTLISTDLFAALRKTLCGKCNFAGDG